ncbi:MAG: glycine--tRNA ligase subunit beta [Pseudomonadota bacterium]
MAELLIELFSEEIPARMQLRAAEDLQRLVNQALMDVGFLPEGVKAFATPRRLALVATGLAPEQPDRREERKGPRVGAPEKAIAGFLKSAGLPSVDACEIRSDKKGEYYVAVIEEKGRHTADVIADFLPDIVQNFPWPKSMRWGEGSLKWVRPLHRILCIFDGEIVPFAVDRYQSCDVTAGHRFMAPAEFKVKSFEDYAAKLRQAHVILDTEERRQIIEGEARTLCEAQGLALKADNGLLTEVAGLAENPVVMVGSFDENFLSLPDEVLTASMRGHQKYFSVFDPKTENLTNKFVVVANIEAPDGGAAMRVGYERVLTARLSDAWYLYQEDLKTPLEDRLADLDRITFFEGLGSVGDKARRISELVRGLAPAFSANPGAAARAGLLAKADLVTGMVNEFPELQGLIGGYYARAQGEAEDVAGAVRDHYKPVGQSDDLPARPVGAAVALADKLDTLSAFFSIGNKPTGSSDPFALRRAALGAISIILNSNVRLPLLSVMPAGEGKGDVGQDLLGFFHDRLTVFLRDKGRRHDRIAAVRMGADETLEDDMVLVVRKLDALDEFLATPDGENLVAAFKRATNILRAEEKKDAVPQGTDVNADNFVEAAETALHGALTTAEKASADAVSKEDFSTAMASLATLRAPIDAFFETVTVNADDPVLRLNRLALLRRFETATASVANFAALEG